MGKRFKLTMSMSNLVVTFLAAVTHIGCQGAFIIS